MPNIAYDCKKPKEGSAVPKVVYRGHKSKNIISLFRGLSEGRPFSKVT